MYHFIAIMSSRRRKLLFTAGAYTVWCWFCLFLPFIIPLPFSLSVPSLVVFLGFLIAAAFNKAPAAEERFLFSHPRAAAYLLALGEAFYWCILLWIVVVILIIATGNAGSAGAIGGFIASLAANVFFLAKTHFAIRREGNSSETVGVAEVEDAARLFFNMKSEQGENLVCASEHGRIIFTDKDFKPAAGILQAFYPGGQVLCKAYAADGVPNGVAQWFYENGAVKAERSFADGVLNGAVKMYGADGRIFREFNYKNGVKDGADKEYYENGAVKAERSFADGVLNGIVRAYYENGQLFREFNYKNGVKNGAAREYYPDGQLSKEAEYIGGKIYGKARKR